MQHLRPTPFDLVFESAAQTSFPAVKAALTTQGRDPRDRDAFLMLGEVVTLLRELRPEEGLGEAIGQLAALVHHGFLFWDAGCRTVELDPVQLEQVLAAPGRRDKPPVDWAEVDPPVFYTQLPERQVWAEVLPGEAHEPLDGYFQYPAQEQEDIRVLGVFGVHPDRPGFSVVEVAGPKPGFLARADGTPLYSSTLPGGTAAGLYSVAGEEELLELAWRTRVQLPPVEATRWRA